MSLIPYRIFLLCFLLLPFTVFPQNAHKSIMQEQSQEYSKYNCTTAQQWDSLFLSQNQGMTRNVLPKTRNNCTLNKVVYGWNPYWAGSTYLNYQWNLLSHLCHFSYEVDYTDGTANSTHNWATDDAVDSALTNGVKVDLCLTLFSNHATFLNNSTAVQTLIDNVISMLQSRGGNGVNIDFEGMASSCQSAFTSFITSFSNQLHAAIPGSELSIAMPSVDWSPSEFDLPAIIPYVDMFIIMGYDYYYGGSSVAGPTDPLYNFLTSYNYTLTKSVTYYLNAGVPSNKLVLGLPYYGKQWATVDNSVGSSTTATGTSPFYNVVRNNVDGYYNTKLWNNASYTPYYTFQISSQWYQCWIDDAYSLGERFDMVNQRGIGGMGIWALGYDDGYTELWDKISDKFSSCATVQCVDTIYDMGGPERNYYANEDYTYTIQPDGASAVQLTFSSFSVTDDTLWIYDGPSTASTLIGAYTSTNSPGTITSSGNALTLKFRSRASNLSTGWMAIWQCIVDDVPPTTAINVTGPWQTQNFTVNFTDADNVGGSGLEKSFFSVSDYNGSEWHASAVNGFSTDEFTTLDTAWKIPASSGTWQISNGELLQSDTTVSNSNIYTSLDQSLSNRYIYHFRAMATAAVYSTNQRRFGFHFYCDDATQTNRGNSYFIYFRIETNKLEFYKIVSNSATQEKVVDNITINVWQWYDYKIIFDRISGKIDVYRDDVFLGTWTDTSPLATNGNYISFRTGNAKVFYDDLEVYRSRSSSATITIGAALTNEIRFQNADPITPSGRIRSVCNDSVGNYSSIAEQNLNIDWTPPSEVSSLNDGTNSDTDTTSSSNSISANWNSSNDPNSGIAYYWYCFGTSPGSADLTGWTSNGQDTAVTHNGVSMTNGQIYYCSVIAVNNAGLLSDTVTSDGQLVFGATAADFYSSDTIICEDDTISFINTSTNAITYYWLFPGGDPQNSTDMNPTVLYDTAGTFDVELHATGIGGSDTLLKQQFIYVDPKAHASFTVIDSLVYLPSANAVFNNTSTDATNYFWDFGDGSTSTDQNPWHTYDSTGLYTVTLIAYNSLCGNDTLVMPDYIHVDSGVGVNEYQDIYHAIIFPVPSSNEATLYIVLDSPDKLAIDLLDLTGKNISEISKGTYAKGKHIFNISREKPKLRSGAYIIRICGNNGDQYVRFIVD